MTLIYEPLRGFVKPQQPARRARMRLNGRPHPKAGTSRQGPAWTALMRQRRALAKAMHALCRPSVKADADSVGWEIVTYIDQLDQQSLHQLQADFAMHWRNSNRRRLLAETL